MEKLTPNQRFFFKELSEFLALHDVEIYIDETTKDSFDFKFGNDGEVIKASIWKVSTLSINTILNMKQ